MTPTPFIFSAGATKTTIQSSQELDLSIVEMVEVSGSDNPSKEDFSDSNTSAGNNSTESQASQLASGDRSLPLSSTPQSAESEHTKSQPPHDATQTENTSRSPTGPRREDSKLFPPSPFADIVLLSCPAANGLMTTFHVSKVDLMRSSGIFKDLLGSQHLSSDDGRAELDLDVSCEVLDVVCTIITPSISLGDDTSAIFSVGSGATPGVERPKIHTVTPELLPSVIQFLAKYQMLEDEPNLQWTAVRIKLMLRSFCKSHPREALKLYGYISYLSSPTWEIEVAWFTFGKLLHETSPGEVADIHPVALHRLHLLHHRFSLIYRGDLLPVTHVGVPIPTCEAKGRCSQCPANLMPILTNLIKTKSGLVYDQDVVNLDGPCGAISRLTVHFALCALRAKLKVIAASIWNLS